MLVAKVSVAIDVAGEVHVWGLDGVDFQQQVSKHLSVMHQMATLPQVYLVFEEAIHMRFSVRASSLPACPKGLDEYPMATTPRELKTRAPTGCLLPKLLLVRQSIQLVITACNISVCRTIDSVGAKLKRSVAWAVCVVCVVERREPDAGPDSAAL